MLVGAAGVEADAGLDAADGAVGALGAKMDGISGAGRSRNFLGGSCRATGAVGMGVIGSVGMIKGRSVGVIKVAGVGKDGIAAGGGTAGAGADTGADAADAIALCLISSFTASTEGKPR